MEYEETMASVNDALDRLHSKARPEQLQGMAKYGTTDDNEGWVSQCLI
jgi:hypothetical protein